MSGWQKKQEKEKLTNDANNLITKIADLKVQEASQLEQNRMTKERLDRLNSVIDRLKKEGMDLE